MKTNAIKKDTQNLYTLWVKKSNQINERTTMNFLMNRLRSGGQKTTHEHPSHIENIVVQILPGQVEEAVHKLQHPGGINLSELRFHVLQVDDEEDDEASVYDRNHHHDNQQEEYDDTDTTSTITYIDIAIFEVPNDCNSQKCDLTEYGVGILEHYDGIRFLNLCSTEGRLKINTDKFIGHHIELPVPTKGPMLTDRVNKEDSEIYIADSGRTFEVMISNCNKQLGRQIDLYGQVIFDSIRSAKSQEDNLGISSEIHLILFGLSICLFFTFCTIRINMGTRAQYTYDRLSSNNRQTTTTDLVITPTTTEQEARIQAEDDDDNSIILHPIQIV
jgi:hypothetical protein